MFKTNNIHNILLVTDKGLRASGNTFRLEDLLIKNNIDLAVYDETKANPLYPEPSLMDKDELKKFYYQLME